MQKFILSVLLFLLLLTTATAETQSEPWIVHGSTHEEVAPGGSGIYNGYYFGMGDFTLGDAAQLRAMTLYTIKIPNAYVATSKDSEYNSVNFKIGAVYVGSGLAGYNKGADYTFIHYWFQELDLSTYSGSHVVTVEGVPTTISSNMNYYKNQGAPTNQRVYKRTYNAARLEWYGWRQATHNIQMSYTFENTITVNFAEPLSSITTYRDDGNQSKFNITQSSEQILHEDSLLTGDNVTYTGSTASLTVTGENQYGDLFSHVFTSTSSETEQTGTVTFNQSHYTDPGRVGVIYTIDGLDLDRYEYYIEVLGSAGEGWWQGVNVEYTELSSASGQSNFTIDRQTLPLPMPIYAALNVYDRTDGMTYVIDTTTTVSYNPATIAPGSVWTDKNSYNTTEVVTIYTDTESGGKLKVDKRDDPLYDWYSIYDGSSNIKLAMQTSYVGAWDVYLYEENTAGDYVITNNTNFTVLADGDTAYFNWWYSPIYQGEPASYDYVATSTNSMISIYDGENTELYRFNASTGYNTGQISTVTSLAVGNWTGSLYDNGTYYNASLEVEASYSWVRLDQADYYITDTIGIEYFIVSQDHAIVLRDANEKTILKWMPGTFMTGQRGVLDYTLIEDNEYGHNVQLQLWNGWIEAGIWTVDVEDVNYITNISYPASHDEAVVHDHYRNDSIGGGGGGGGTQGDGSIIAECQSIAELAGFRGEVGLFILSILIIIMASASMLLGHFPVQGVLCIDILLFFGFIGIGFIPILYLILFGVVAGLIVFGTIFFRKAG